MLRSAAGQFVPPIVRHLLPRKPPPVVEGPPTYLSWAEARRASSGYEATNVLEKVKSATRAVVRGEAAYDRDSTLFAQIQYSWPVLAGLLHAAGRCSGTLSVLDFGGALGSSYRQNRQLLQHLTSLRWSVVEQPPYVEAGRAEFEDDVLRFYADVDECVRREKPNVWLASGSIQYLENPQALIRRLSVHSIPFGIIDRVLMLDRGPTRLIVQRVSPDIYDASFPCWVFNRAHLEKMLTDSYEILARFDAHPGISMAFADEAASYHGFLVAKPAPA